MNAGGSTFWLALGVSLSLAGAATWIFLRADSTASMDQGLDMSSAGVEESAIEQEVEETLDADPGGVEADVTFSFATEVMRLEDGRIIEQDDLFKVSCRGTDGAVLWQYGMDAPVLAVVEVDANDDGPMEWLLVDSRQGVGLDPDGRPIPGFAIRPGTPITSFAMVDYEGDGRERYLFGLADGRVLNHRKLGEATPGWRHESKGTAVQAIAHLRAGRKDYICTVDEGGVVMLLKRNGQRRVRTPVQLERQSGVRPVAFEIRSEIENSAIISRNAEGVLETRTFGEGMARPATPAQAQLFETAEARWVSSD